MGVSAWTLSELAAALSQPQHRLIYLCERGVIVPDIADAMGRGSSRRFSARNLLEFAIALKLRELSMSVGAVAVILHVLRTFENIPTRKIPGFQLGASLREKGAPELRILISDGKRLFFSLGLQGVKPILFGGIDFQRLTNGKGLSVQERDLATEIGPKGQANGHERVRLEISVTGIAKDLPL